MSIQIFQDAENMVPDFGNGKKNKHEDSHFTRQNVPKPNKRPALGNLTNNVQARIQPSRAAKDKHKTAQGRNTQNTKQSFKILEDEPARNQKREPPPSVFYEALSMRKDSPMILSPIPSTDSFEEIKLDDIDNAAISDIDVNADIVFGVPEYAQDIHNYLKKIQVKYAAKPQYMRKQADVNTNMRAILVDWLVEVSEEYKLKPQTLFLTINYIDRFLSCMSVLRGKLQLVGAACMLVAAKFEEIYPPEVSEFVYITDDTYTSKQVLRMEHLVLKTLSFDLSVPTCRDFLTRYLLASGAKEESQHQYLAQYLCELTLIEYELVLKYTPSMIAASAVCLANYTLNNTSWTPTLEFYSGYQMIDIYSCVSDLHKLFKNASNHAQQAVLTKYKSPKFGCVSHISPPDCLLI